MSPGTQNRKLVLIAKKFVGGSFQMGKIVGIGPDTTQNTQNELNENRPFDQAAMIKMGQRIKMPDVISF
jgi:hypothetical protein